jgi:hypothetical protein
MENNSKIFPAESWKIFEIIGRFGAVLCLSLTLLSVAHANTEETAPVPDHSPQMTVEEQWGVRIESLRISAAGNLLDFRYRIIDPEKASYLVDRRNKAYIIEQKSGMVLSVPNTAKVGPLRQTVRYGLPQKDKVYFILFGNPHVVKHGDRMTVVIGDFRAENIVVE